MKKTYISPALVAVMLDSKCNMCVGSLPVSDEEGDSQLSRKYWGKAPWETEEDLDDEKPDSWY